jgi:Flp pilus assembly protein CpaB
MRKNRQIILTILITLALVAIAWSAGLGKGHEKTGMYIMAKEAIPAGSQIKPEQLKMIELPVGAVSDCYMTDLKEAEAMWTNADILEGELIGRHRLCQKAAGIQYPDAGTGRRLLTINLDPQDANGYWLAAGNRVDLILVPRSRENGLAVRIMESIRIMAVLNDDAGGGGMAAAQKKPLLCLDLDARQVTTLCDSFGLYDLHLSVINEKTS